MIVLDASAITDWLLGVPDRAAAIVEAMLAARSLHTLDFAHLEVVAALRGLAAGQQLAAGRAEAALGDLAAAPILRHRAAPLTGRTWALRHNLTPYDAAYVALAEVLRCPLVTTDARLARTRGHDATIVAVRSR